MWKCPRCDRIFAKHNQSHICTKQDLDSLFVGRPDSLLLAFDKLLVHVIDWDGCSVGMSTKSIIFSRPKAWLIIKPLKKQLDIKFYWPERMNHPLISKYSQGMANTFAHHIRISDEDEVTTELLRILKMAYDRVK